MNLKMQLRPPKRSQVKLRALGTIEAWRRDPSRSDWLLSAARWECAAQREARDDLPNSANRAADYHVRAELCIIFGQTWSELEARERQRDPDLALERARLKSPWIRTGDLRMAPRDLPSWLLRSAARSADYAT